MNKTTRLLAALLAVGIITTVYFVAFLVLTAVGMPTDVSHLGSGIYCAFIGYTVYQHCQNEAEQVDRHRHANRKD